LQEQILESKKVNWNGRSLDLVHPVVVPHEPAFEIRFEEMVPVLSQLIGANVLFTCPGMSLGDNHIKKADENIERISNS
tara:strand:- start:839 stop:1075 length:237 start_codon:yes stop_codon:yes gene_type:complete